MEAETLKLFYPVLLTPTYKRILKSHDWFSSYENSRGGGFGNGLICIVVDNSTGNEGLLLSGPLCLVFISIDFL